MKPLLHGNIVISVFATIIYVYTLSILHARFPITITIFSRSILCPLTNFPSFTINLDGVHDKMDLALSGKFMAMPSP